MAYLTAAQLDAAISDLGQAQLTAESGSTIDSTILTEVITQASSRIDMYLAARYTVPVTGDSTALAILVTIAVPIATYLLYKRRLIAGKNDEITEDYKRALSELEMLRDGKLSLPGAGSGGVIGSEPLVEDYDPIVGAEIQVFGKELQLY